MWNVTTGLQADADARSCLSARQLENCILNPEICCLLKLIPMNGVEEQLTGYTDDYCDLLEIFCETGEMQAAEDFIPRSNNFDPTYLRYLYKILSMHQTEPNPEGSMQFMNDPSLWIGKNIKFGAYEAPGWYFFEGEERTHQMHDYCLRFGMRGQSIYWRLVIEGDICILTNPDYDFLDQPSFCMVLNQHFRVRLARPQFCAVTLFVILKLKVLFRRAKKERRRATWIFPKIVFRFDGLIAREILSYCWGPKVFQTRVTRYPRWLNWLNLLLHQSMKRVDRIFKPPLQGREYDLLMVRDVLNQFLKRRLQSDQSQNV